MGLLTEGEPLTWEETKQLADHVREHGIDQFVNLYHQLLDRKGDVLKWGDEVNNIFRFACDIGSLLAYTMYLYVFRSNT